MCKENFTYVYTYYKHNTSHILTLSQAISYCPEWMHYIIVYCISPQQSYIESFSVVWDLML